jgi:hypothetical protein
MAARSAKAHAKRQRTLQILSEVATPSAKLAKLLAALRKHPELVEEWPLR